MAWVQTLFRLCCPCAAATIHQVELSEREPDEKELLLSVYGINDADEEGPETLSPGKIAAILAAQMDLTREIDAPASVVSLDR